MVEVAEVTGSAHNTAWLDTLLDDASRTAPLVLLATIDAAEYTLAGAHPPLPVPRLQQALIAASLPCLVFPAPAPSGPALLDACATHLAPHWPAPRVALLTPPTQHTPT